MKEEFAFSLFDNDTAAALHVLVEVKDDKISSEGGWWRQFSGGLGCCP